ncbi:hypothetical protein J5N97_013189 [Dioscorea zingiberensis]|uniref:Uncharacterized protein n=1 Tax=Dioscorea zingiberensis TaxID=325984 RepID=A0A9D5HIF6_9LILI|nr:hypothetical protein J5N97_013189 [Dioscorea zingiberensis]
MPRMDTILELSGIVTKLVRSPPEMKQKKRAQKKNEKKGGMEKRRVDKMERLYLLHIKKKTPWSRCRCPRRSIKDPSPKASRSPSSSHSWQHTTPPASPPPSPLEKLLGEKSSRSLDHFYSPRSPSFLERHQQRELERNDLISPCVGSSSPFHTQSLHVQLVKKGSPEDVFQSNNLINSYVRTCHMVVAHEIHERNAVSWTCLIAGYTQHGLLEGCYWE